MNKRWKSSRKLLKILEYDGSGMRADHYRFVFGDGKEIPIKLFKDEEGTKIICSCKHCSTHNNQYWCSYKNALVLYISQKNKAPEQRHNQ